VAKSGGVAPFLVSFKVDMDDATNKAAKEANNLASTVMGAYGKLGGLAGAVGTTALTTLAGLATTMAFTVGAASKFEDSFAGIRKTVDASEADFNQLAVSVRKLATEIPIATNQLNAIGELGGQLGIESTGLPTFIETISKLGVATRLSTETAALGLARMKTIFQLGNEDISKLASSLVDLGNNFAALEDEILSTSLRLAAGAKVAGATAADTLAIATALQAVGVQSQAGGTAVARVFQQLTVAIQGGKEQLDVFSRVSGVLPEQFKQLADNNPAQAFNIFLQGLQRLSSEGGNVVEVLDALGLKQQRTIRALLALSEAGDLVTETLARGNAAFEINNALNEEAAKRFETLKSQTKLMKNAFTELRIEIGNTFLPLAKALTQTLTGVALAAADDEKSAEVGFTNMSNSMKVLTAGFATLGLAMAMPIFNFFKFISIQAKVASQTSKAAVALQELTRQEIKHLALSKSKEAHAVKARKLIGNQTMAYMKMTQGLRMMLPQLALAAAAIAVFGLANARANKNSKASAKIFFETASAFVPLQSKLEEKQAEFNKLQNEGFSSDILKIYKKELEIINEELEDINISGVRAFMNIPKFMKDISVKEAEKISTAFSVLGNQYKALGDLTQDPIKIETVQISGTEVEFDSNQGGSGLSFVKNTLGEEGDLAEELAKAIGVELQIVEDLLAKGDLTGLLQLISVKGLDDATIFANAGNVINDTVTNIESAFSRAEAGSDEFTKTQKRQLGFLNNQIPALSELGVRMSRIDKEQDFLAESAQTLVDRYNAMQKETGGATITLDEFIGNSITADKVIKKVYGSTDVATDSAKAFGEVVIDVTNYINDQIDKMGELGTAYSKLSQVSFISPDDIIAGAQELEDRVSFITNAIAILISQGQVGLAAQVSSIEDTGEAFGTAVAFLRGLGDENLAPAFADLNQQFVDSNSELSGIQGTGEQVTQELRDQILETNGLNSVQVANAQINFDNLQLVKAATSAREDELNALLSMFRMTEDIKKRNRAIRDTQQEIAELQQDIVFGDIQISLRKKEQLEVDLAREAVLEAIDKFGKEGVVTASEELEILQMSLSLDKMRDKLSSKMTARQKKSLRDKEKEVKFLELAVEQGVADNLDLDAAREELEEMRNPMSEVEKKILNLQVKAAEAELAAAKSRAEGLSPDIISAIESYNDQLKVQPERYQKIADATSKYNAMVAENNIKIMQNGIEIDKLRRKYPDLNNMFMGLAKELGIPTSYVQEVLVAMDTEMAGFISYQDQAVNNFLNNTTAVMNHTKNVINEISEEMRTNNIFNGIQMFANPHYQQTQNQSGTMGVIGQGGYYTGRRVDMQNYTGGNVPIGRSSLVGERGPEVIMSTPGGTSVFSNKTGQGTGGVTVENMNLNITGLPADPITARKMAMNIRKELTKLEKEGTSGTGLRNR